MFKFANLQSHPIDFREKNSSHDGKLKTKKKVEIYFHQARNTAGALGLLLGAGGLLGQEDGLDVGQDAALGDGDAGQQLVQLLVIPGTKV